MRVWDIHPGYLSRQSLLGQHVEIHALFNVLAQGKKGYANHPETRRWAGRLPPLVERHDQTVMEMTLRGYKHQSPIVYDDDKKLGGKKRVYVDIPARQFEILRRKYDERKEEGRIPLAKTAGEYWAHHQYAVMARGYDDYLNVERFLRQRKDDPITKDQALIDTVNIYLEKDPDETSVKYLLGQLWDFFQNLSTIKERESFFFWERQAIGKQLDCLYRLALRYDIFYLKQATVFADLKLHGLEHFD